MAQTIPQGSYSHNIEPVGYHELNARPAFKLAMQEVNNRWYLYVAHLWHRGWSVLDVSDPATPEFCAFIPGPENTWTIQIQVAEGKMVTALERIAPGWGGGELRNFYEKAGRFGPHNHHHPNHQACLEDRDDVAYLTYFNAGLRVFDIRDARMPKEFAYFVPPDPQKRIGTKPSKLVAQTEDVIVDRHGFIYISDKNLGIYILRLKQVWPYLRL